MPHIYMYWSLSALLSTLLPACMALSLLCFSSPLCAAAGADNKPALLWDYAGRYVLQAECQNRMYILDIQRDRNICTVRLSDLAHSRQYKTQGQAHRGSIEFYFGDVGGTGVPQKWNVYSGKGVVSGSMQLGVAEPVAVTFSVLARYMHSVEHRSGQYHSDCSIPIVSLPLPACRQLNDNLLQAQKEAHEQFVDACAQTIRSYPLLHRDEIVIPWMSRNHLSVQRHISSTAVGGQVDNWHDCATYRMDENEPIRLTWSDLIIDAELQWGRMNTYIVASLQEKGASMYAQTEFHMEDVVNVVRVGDGLVLYIAAKVDGQRQQGPYALSITAQQLAERAISLKPLD